MVPWVPCIRLLSKIKNKSNSFLAGRNLVETPCLCFPKLQSIDCMSGWGHEWVGPAPWISGRPFRNPAIKRLLVQS